MSYEVLVGDLRTGATALAADAAEVRGAATDGGHGAQTALGGVNAAGPLTGVLGRLVTALDTVSTVTGDAVETGGATLSANADRYAADDGEAARRLAGTISPQDLRTPLR